MIKTLLLDECE